MGIANDRVVADGNPALDDLQSIVDAFAAGGGAGKPLHLKVDISWAPTLDGALAEAHGQWRFNALGSGVNWDIRMPEDFDVATRFVRPEDMRRTVLVVSDPAQLVDWLADRMALGFETINLHNVGRNQAAFLDMIGENVLSGLSGQQRTAAPGDRAA